MQHVYPLNDLRRHQLEGADCWCQPRVELSDPKTGEPYAEALVIHNSADGREAVEQAEGYMAYLDAQERKAAAGEQPNPLASIPCPFCGESDLGMLRRTGGGGIRGGPEKSWVQCASCRAEGPHVMGNLSGLLAWNRRTPPPPAPAAPAPAARRMQCPRAYSMPECYHCDHREEHDERDSCLVTSTSCPSCEPLPPLAVAGGLPIRGKSAYAASLRTGKRVYLCGPMTGLPAYNYPAFNAAADKLRERGWTVVNPAELTPYYGQTWEQCMRRDIRELVTCDRLALLPAWETSRGAQIEHWLAKQLGIPSADMDDYLSEERP